ncbi:MAG: alpha/beta fold hydrolase [Xanthobacteraceae bacterium]
MPFIDANGVSLHYQLAGAQGPSIVLLHELGGTLHSWDAVALPLAERRRVLRYDQRGSGLSEKVRREFTNDILVDDFVTLAEGVGLVPPYHFVTVAAAATQALRFLEKHPARVGSLVLCNPAPGVDASRATALDERAAFAMREGMRASLPTTLAISYPPTLGERAAYEAYRGRYLANDPVGFGYGFRALARTNMVHMLPQVRCPVLVVAGRHDSVRPHAGTAELAKKIPGARFELIEAGHFMPTQGPEPLLRLLEEFLPQA